MSEHTLLFTISACWRACRSRSSAYRLMSWFLLSSASLAWPIRTNFSSIHFLRSVWCFSLASYKHEPRRSKQRQWAHISLTAEEKKKKMLNVDNRPLSSPGPEWSVVWPVKRHQRLIWNLSCSSVQVAILSTSSILEIEVINIFNGFKVPLLCLFEY